MWDVLLPVILTGPVPDSAASGDQCRWHLDRGAVASPHQLSGLPFLWLAFPGEHVRVCGERAPGREKMVAICSEDRALMIHQNKMFLHEEGF